MKKYYFNKVLCEGEKITFAKQEDGNVYSYNDDDEVKEKLSSLPDYEYVTTRMLYHQAIKGLVPTMIFRDTSSANNEYFGVYRTTKDKTLNVKQLFKVCELLTQSKNLEGTIFFFVRENGEYTIREVIGATFLGDCLDKVRLNGHYVMAMFTAHFYARKFMDNLDTMSIKYIYAHTISNDYYVIVKAYN